MLCSPRLEATPDAPASEVVSVPAVPPVVPPPAVEATTEPDVPAPTWPAKEPAESGSLESPSLPHATQISASAEHPSATPNRIISLSTQHNVPWLTLGQPKPPHTPLIASSAGRNVCSNTRGRSRAQARQHPHTVGRCLEHRARACWRSPTSS